MAKTREDFAKEGAERARQDWAAGRRGPLKQQWIGWQSFARGDGYNQEMARLEGSLVAQPVKAKPWRRLAKTPDFKTSYFAQAIASNIGPHWRDQATREHAQKLAKDLCQGLGSPKRLERLERSLTRLARRHGYGALVS